jgi:hypothetical protein
MTMVRHLASIDLRSNSCLYSQWIAAEANNISDSLSNDFHIPDEQLTSCPKKLFHGWPLAVEFSRKGVAAKNNRARQAITWSCLQPTSYPFEIQTHSVLNSLKTTDIRLLEHLGMQPEKVTVILNNTDLVKWNLLEPPGIMWHRPTDWLTDLTPD